MSGIAGIVYIDGQRVNTDVLDRMTRVMHKRAPDGCQIWCEEGVGLGHAMLRTEIATRESDQPRSLDGDIWITADARIDGREDLIGALRRAGQDVRDPVPDADLILCAYKAFGEKFLDHLIGDFSFVLWDSRSRQLLCARDHFGVRPLYYAQIPGGLLLSSDLDAVRLAMGTPDVLDETAVGDFLLFGTYLDTAATIYRDIKALPPASQLTFDVDGLRVRRYWEIPAYNEIRYRKKADYVDHFRELFERAVTDRLGAGSVTLELSGGMDSTSIAAVAASEAKRSGRALSAYTVTCHDLIPEDDEYPFTQAVADHLGLPLRAAPLEDYDVFDRFEQTSRLVAQPTANSNSAQHQDFFAWIEQQPGRVLLSGAGGDAVLGNSNRYYARLLRQKRYFKLLHEIKDHVVHTGTLAGLGLRSELQPARRTMPWMPDFPPWLKDKFVSTHHLKDRWEYFWCLLHNASDSSRQLRLPWGTRTFQDYESLPMPITVRYPFYDIRLVRFLLSVPTHIKMDKWVLRQAMARRLPPPILKRAKTSLAGDPVYSKLAKGMTKTPFILDQVLMDNRRVEWSAYRSSYDLFCKEGNAGSTWNTGLVIRPLAFESWWISRNRTEVNSCK